jgi:hypothetical protein
VAILLNYGADVNHCDNKGISPLLAATLRFLKANLDLCIKYERVLGLLLRHKADIDQKEKVSRIDMKNGNIKSFLLAVWHVSLASDNDEHIVSRSSIFWHHETRGAWCRCECKVRTKCLENQLFFKCGLAF